MTRAMTAPLSRNACWNLCRNARLARRVAVSGVALYALVLQALLGGLAPPPVAAPSGQICLPPAAMAGEPGSRGEAPAERSGPDATDCLAACCLAACAGGPAIRPADSRPAAWPARRGADPGWREAGGPGESAARPGTARARAPPVI